MKYEAYGYLTKGLARAPIDASRYFEVKEAKRTCLFSLELEEKFALLIDNFAEFECELLRMAESSLLWDYQGHAASMQERLCLDRRLVNLLTACRLYLDQTDHMVSSLFGKDSEEPADVRAFKKALYDDHWGYRLMEAIRNHVQHSGLIVHAIGYPRFLSAGEGADYTEFAVTPQAQVKFLVENTKFKKSVLAELAEKGDKIDLRGPTREYLACLVRLHDKLRETIENPTAEARAAYESAVNDFKVIDGHEAKLASLLETLDDGRKNDEVALVTEFLDYHDKLRSRNVVNKSLERATASNTDQKRRYTGTGGTPKK